jgi:CheY-like chemotaxis protein
MSLPTGERSLPPNVKVLIVDDDPAVAELWRIFIMKAAPQASTTLAYDGADIVRLARELRPDVVLMDLAMPDMDGFAVTRALKADPETAGIPVLAVSGFAYGAQPVLSAGCDGYLRKPASLSQLVAGIAQVLKVRAHDA